MNDMNRILDESAPWTSANDPSVRRAIGALSASAATESAPAVMRNPRGAWSRRLTTGVIVASLGLAGAGAAAAATFGWWGGQGEPELLLQNTWVIPDDCVAGFRIAPDGPADAGVVEAARDALKSIDAAGLDLAATERALRDEGFFQDDVPEGQLRMMVLAKSVHQHVKTVLVEQGFAQPTEGWGLLGGTECSAESP